MSMIKAVSVQAEMGKETLVTVAAGNHTILIDQPVAGGGNDRGATPLQYFLASAAGCLATVSQIIAQQRKMDLRGIKINVDGDINVAGLMGQPSDDPIGFRQLTVTAEIDADMTPAEKEAFFNEVCERCPVHDNIARASVIKRSVA